METIFYLLKVILCSGVFFLYYFLALRNKVFHQWNRFYLLISVVLSLLAPLAQTTIYHYTEASSGKTIQLLKVVESANSYLDEVTIGNGQAGMTYGWIYLIYFLVSVVIMALFVHSLLQVNRIIRSHLVKAIDRIYFVSTRVPGTPFSFLRYIFWNEEIDINSSTGRQIFEHELVHVREKHSIDKLFMQLMLVFFWCNPFFWFIRRELKMIHEFIADKRSVAHHGEAAFASMVLQAAYPSQYNHLTNSFFQTSIKRRLMMLKKMQRPGWSYISRIVALPLLVVTVAAFTVRTKTVHTPVPLEKQITVVIDAGHGMTKGIYTGARIGSTYEDVINLAIARKVRDENHNPNIHIILSREGDENVDLKRRVEITATNKADLYISIHVNAAPPVVNSNGTNGVNESLSGMEVVIPREMHAFHNGNLLLGSSIVNQLKNIYSTDQELKIKKVNTYVLEHSPCPAALIEFGYLTNPRDRAFITKPENQEKMAAGILASIEQYAIAAGSEKPVMDTVPVSKEISSINVNKANNTITIDYTNGQTETLTMEEARKRDLIRKEGDAKVNATVTNKPLYVVNGEIYYGDPDRIEPTSIQQIDVLKGETALKKYGQKGKNGAVEITLKKNSSIAPVKASITRIQQEAHIDPEAWKKFLESNLSPVLERISKKAPEGKYTTKVKFMVNTNGSLADITVEEDPGYGIGEEVKNMMQLSPLWEPATEDGHPVNSYHTQPITLVVSK